MNVLSARCGHASVSFPVDGNATNAALGLVAEPSLTGTATQPGDVDEKA